jgi:hypothetical protein
VTAPGASNAGAPPPVALIEAAEVDLTLASARRLNQLRRLTEEAAKKENDVARMWHEENGPEDAAAGL